MNEYTADEEWRAIPGYEGYYEVSNRGQVRSVPRTLPDGRVRKGKVLRQCTTKGNGRLKVTLSRNGRAVNVKVHQLVAQAFLGSAPEGKTLVLHSDGNHLNNDVTNLRWGNYSDNVRDSITHGTHRNQYTVEKPWHDAKAGEVWVLSIDGDDEIVCIVTPSGPDFEPVAHPVWATIARGSERIATARRIWPEVS